MFQRLFVTLVLCYVFSTNVFGQNTWIKTIGGSDNDEGISIFSTIDGGYVITGYTGTNDLDFTGMNKGSYDVFVIKYDSNHKEVWKNIIGGWKGDFGYSITHTLDSGCVITGTTTSNDGDFGGMNKGGEDIFIVKLNKEGKIVWKKLIGGSQDEVGHVITQTSDSGFVVTGRTNSNNGDIPRIYGQYNDCFLLKLDRNGNIMWSKVIGGNDEDVGQSVTLTNDGGIIVTGYSGSNDGDFSEMNKRYWDVFVIKFDSIGNIIWKKTFGGSKWDKSYSIVCLEDNSLLVTGNTDSNDGDFRDMNKGGNEVFIVKLDSIGNIKWKKTFGGTNEEETRSITVTKNNGVILVGNTNSNNGDFSLLNKKNGTNDLFIVKLDTNGDLVWKRTYGGTGNDQGRSIIYRPNGDFLILGYTDSKDYDFTGLTKGGYHDIFVMKLDSNGNLNNTTSINEFSEPTTTLSVHPNPFHNSTTISYRVETPSNVRIELLNTLGQTIEVLREDYTDIGTYQLPLNVSTLSSGMYSVRMRYGSMNEVVPVWVVR